jgi:hypothetical protein
MVEITGRTLRYSEQKDRRHLDSKQLVSLTNEQAKSHAAIPLSTFICIVISDRVSYGLQERELLTTVCHLLQSFDMQSGSELLCQVARRRTENRQGASSLVLYNVSHRRHTSST